MNLIANRFMEHYSTQQLDQPPASFWQLCVLLLLLNSLAFTGWIDLREVKTSGKSGFIAEFNQVTLANLRDNYRSLLDIKNLTEPKSSDGDSEQHWLVYSDILNFNFAALINVVNLHYLTFFIMEDIKYHLHPTRAPPHQ